MVNPLIYQNRSPELCMKKPCVISLFEKLDHGKNNQFIPCMETESFNVACQKIDGEHSFKHLNREHDEILLVLSGNLNVWTDDGEFELTQGDCLQIPKGVTHGELFGKKASILILEGTL